MWVDQSHVEEIATDDLGSGQPAGLTLSAAELTRAVHELQVELRETARLATHDPLTGLPNRRTVLERITEATETAHAEHPVAVLFIDVDRFKLINDLYGHDVGDQVLVEIADRLRGTVNEGDDVARLGGDEFVVVSRDASVERLTSLGQRITAAVGPTIDLGHRTLPMSVSIGVALAHREVAPGGLISNADAAMYRAKQAGRAAIVHFDDQMQTEMSDRACLERDLTAALQDGQLAVHYQPIYRLSDHRIVGFEALVRWMHPSRGMLTANDFVPLAEDVGQVWAIDAFVLAETGRQAAVWQGLDPTLSDLIMSVNLSAQQFRDSGVIDTIDRVVTQAGITPSTFQLEVSEATIMDQRSGAPSRTIAGLHDLGVRLAVDNFGSAHSSLACLKELPLDVLNMDRRFTAGLGSSHDDEAIVTAILGLARAFGMEAVAEGVEDERQASWLRAQGCQLAQGYLFSRPIDAELSTELLAEQTSTHETGGPARR